MPSQKKSSATIRDVASRAGISVATVSRFVNRTVPVSEEVAARIQTAMNELKYVPRAAARSLATSKTNTLGFLLSDIAGDFFAPLLSGVESVTRSCGYDLLISTSVNTDHRKDLPLPLGPHNTDGLLIFTDSLDERLITHCFEAGLPMVLIHQSAPATMNIPCVTVENKAASFHIVDHLIQVHQRRRILLMNGPAKHEDARWREIGYRQALDYHKLPFDPAFVLRGDFDRSIAHASLAQFMAAGGEFDAVFSSDDESAIGVLTALQEAGKRVPEEVSVVGFDDQRLSAYLNPSLTTVRAPTEEVGRTAARQLIRLVRTGEADLLTLLPTEIIIRRSCGCKPGEELHLKRR